MYFVYIIVLLFENISQCFVIILWRFEVNIVCFMSSVSLWESSFSVETEFISGFDLSTRVNVPHGQFLVKSVCMGYVFLWVM